MSRRAILQIGTEKTGTTSLQAFLAVNRDRLARRGIRYPRFPGDMNHTGLAAYAMDDGAGATRSAPPSASTARPTSRALRTRIEAQAEAELGQPAHRRSSATSTATAGSGPRARGAAPADLLTRASSTASTSPSTCAGRTRWRCRLYSTRLKSGDTDSDILPRVSPDDPYFNYDRSLALWEEVFGRAHVHVRLFDRSELIGGDVVTDFLAAWDLGTPAEYRPVAQPERVDLGRWRRTILRRLNARVKPIAGLPLDAVRGPLSAELARHFPGKGARPAPGRGRGVLRQVPRLERGAAPALLPGAARALRRGLRRLPRGEPTATSSAPTRWPPSPRACRPPMSARSAASRPRSRSARPPRLGTRASPSPPIAALRRAARLAARPRRGPPHPRRIPAAPRPRSTRPRPPPAAPPSCAPTRASTGTSSASCCAQPATSTAPPRRRQRALDLDPGHERLAPRARHAAAPSSRPRRPPPADRPRIEEGNQDGQDHLPAHPRRLPRPRRRRPAPRRPRARPRQIDAGVAHRGADLGHLDVTPGAFLDIGAFCNLRGGTLNNVRCRPLLLGRRAASSSARTSTRPTG